MTAKRIALLAVALLAGARGGAAQEPAGPPPPSSRVEDRGTAGRALPGAAAGTHAAARAGDRAVLPQVHGDGARSPSPPAVRLGGGRRVVVITRQTPEQDESLLFRGTSPFDGPLLGGLVSQAPELQARGIPTGQGDVEAGFHAGGGLELRLSKGVSVNMDYRLTGIGGAGSRLHAFSSGLGIHW